MALRCGCDPRKRFVCPDHCQWRGCTETVHIDACVRGERTDA